MDQETDRIKQHIDSERERLGENLHEIEDRVKNATDWRVWFETHPSLMLGAALASGFIFSRVVGKSSRRTTSSGNHEPDALTSTSTRRSGSPSSTSSQIHGVAEILDNTLAALVGVVTGKFQDFLADAIPGFREQYDEVNGRRVRSTAGQTDRAYESPGSAV